MGYGIYPIVTRGFGTYSVYYLLPVRGYHIPASAYTCIEPTQTSTWSCLLT